MQELQQLKANAAETAHLVVGSKADKDALCRDTQNLISYYEGVKKNTKVALKSGFL